MLKLDRTWAGCTLPPGRVQCWTFGPVERDSRSRTTDTASTSPSDPAPGSSIDPVELPATIRTFLAAHAAGEARTAVRLFTDDLIGELTISADVAARPSGREIDP